MVITITRVAVFVLTTSQMNWNIMSVFAGSVG